MSFDLLCSAGIPRSNSIGRVSDLSCGADNLLNSEDAIRRGEYTVIRSLIRVLEVQPILFLCSVSQLQIFLIFDLISINEWYTQGGVEGKRQVDKVIDKCASMQVFPQLLSYLLLFGRIDYLFFISDKGLIG